MTDLDTNLTATWSWRWRSWSRADQRALWLFVVIPSVLFVVPALFNHPAIDADNLIQNFPLRVLVGRQLDGGHLPLLNPYGNAGTPLLAGMNAGAAYPLTLLFAVLPGIMAWIINLIVVYVVSALGVFSLARWHGLSTRASVMAALSYTYLGSMVSQVVHLGVVQGFAFLPWEILLLLSLARRLRTALPTDRGAKTRALAPWVVSGTILWSLIFLTGEPRAIAEAELVALVALIAVFFFPSSYRLRTWPTRGVYALALGVSFAWGVALAGVQLLPAWSFIHFSQRSVITYSFFGAGSLPPRWTMLLGLPDVLGGNGALGTSGFFAPYSLPEVTGYAGILALCAGASFLAHCSRRGWRGAERDYVLYLVLAVVGLFAAWGNFTVVGHLFRAIPLFGSTRLQSRNTVLIDLGLALLLGWWIDQLERRVSRRARLGALAAPVTIGLLCVVALAWGPWLVRHMGVSASLSIDATNLKLALLVHLAIAGLVLGLLLVGARHRSLVTWLVVVLVLDLVTFALFDATGLIGGPTPTEPSYARATRVLATQGRFALVDPSGANTQLYRQLGEPNMNVFTGLASAQGYGALVSNFYDANTGTHPTNGLSGCHLAAGTFAQLRLESLVVASSLLLSSRPNGVARSCATAPRVTRAARYFGEVLQLREIDVTLVGHARDQRAATLRLLNGNGVAVGPTYRLDAGETRTQLIAGTRASGFVVTSPTRSQLSRASVVTSGHASYFLNGAFDLALSSPTWRLRATLGDVQSFRAVAIRPRAWIAGPPGTSRVTAITTSPWGDAWITVRAARESVLERSEAYLPGWRATAVNDRNGAHVELNVARVGLIQRVTVPAGTWTIHFHYHAPYIEAGLLSSSLSGVALVASLVALRRRRFDKVNA
ncbi:MAG: hypothetical protein KGJ10_04745 [Acidobacteriota bacterium]|nr:hypothetical protein [Acidobacteriota bacterium]MDE3044115.1 hypothetical protein [Acidobacteriota bacterium]